MNVQEEKMVSEYERSVGHPPKNIHADDPDWRYSTMTREQREEHLGERLLEECNQQECNQQGALFDV